MNTDYRPYTTLTEVPEDIFITIRVRMYALGALVWDYVDTVLDIARSMRRHELKKPCRTVRGLRADYDYMRKTISDPQYLQRETQWAIDFEAYVMPITRGFISGFRQEHNQTCRALEGETYWLIIAVQQAICVLEALIHYTHGCDIAMTRYGVDIHRKSILPPHFRKLALILPQFCGDRFIRSNARKKAAADIAMQLTKIVVSDKDGDLPQPDL